MSGHDSAIAFMYVFGPATCLATVLLERSGRPALVAWSFPLAALVGLAAALILFWPAYRLHWWLKAMPQPPRDGTDFQEFGDPGGLRSDTDDGPDGR